MKFSSHIIVAAALVFSLSGYGCDSQSSGAEEVVEACEAVCDRLDECGTDLRLFVPGTTDLGEEADCFATCDDLANLEPEISQSCKDAITTVFECTESLNCNVVENFDFTRQGRILLNTSPGNDNLNNKVFTSPPQHFVEAYNSCEGTAEECDGHFAASCGLARNARDYDYCPVNTNCIRFPFVFGGDDWQICSVSGFDMITMLVDDCATEYIAMAEECRGEPKF